MSTCQIIRRWDNGAIIYTGEHATLCEAVEHCAREGISLYRADLRGAILSGAILNWAILRGAKLNGADLNGADLNWACLREADLRRASLRGANLIGADLSWTKGLAEHGSRVRVQS